MIIDISEVKRLLIRVIGDREWIVKRGRFHQNNISYYFDETAVYKSDDIYILDIGEGKYRILRRGLKVEILLHRKNHYPVKDSELLRLIEKVIEVKPVKDVRYLSLGDRQLITGGTW